jgi:hypothetical protein
MSITGEQFGGAHMFLTAEFLEAKWVISAIEDLQNRGFETDDLDIFSAEPVELPPGLLERESRMSLFAVAGAVALFLLAAAFVAFTQFHLRVVTGGMPIFSFWATGVIFYEFTMLGAIATTFLVFLWEGGILRRRRAAGPVPAPETGRIYLRVRCAAKHSAVAGESLYRSGAAAVKRTEAAS